MRKPISFSDYKKIQKASYNDFNYWITEVYTSAYKDGYEDGYKECVDSNNECLLAEVDDDRMMEILLSVKGIGKNRAEQVMEKLSQEGIFE